MTIEVKGLAELQAKMKSLPAKIQSRILNAALLAGGRVIAKAAKARVPVLTGNVRRKIVAKRGRPRGGIINRVIVGVRHGKEQASARLKKITEDAYYYRFLERGYHAIGRRSRKAFRQQKKHFALTGRRAARFIPARPFLANALRAGTTEALEVIRSRLSKGIQKLAAQK